MIKEKTNSLIFKKAHIGPEFRTTVKIRLDDQCNNGHEDFSITADIDERIRKAGGDKWRDYSGGCCHDEILKVFPQFKQFVDLHLSDQEGSPIHCVANGFYWYNDCPGVVTTQEYHGGSGQGGKNPEECLRILKEHLRASDEQIAEIMTACPRTEAEFSYTLERLGFRAQWAQEAAEAIRVLEVLTDNVFESRATRRQWEPLGEGAVALIKERAASGYYTPEVVAARDEQKRKNLIAAQVAGIEETYAKAVADAGVERTIALIFAKRGFRKFSENIIYYKHTNELCCNWTSTSKLWTKEEFEDFKNSIDLSTLPKGITFTFQEKPNY